MSQPFEVVIGLEVHAELSTAGKIFCGCPAAFGAPPNTHICPVCLGLPGALPMLNRQALLLGLRAGLALGCTVVRRTKFDRKNYFYPDLPKAYQISQFDLPLARGGGLAIEIPSGEKRIGITRVHLEEDAGKLLHQSRSGQIGSAESSLVDYNRAGVPLLEIVSEPDLRSADEAYAYLTALKEILRYAAVSDCNMEEGSLRCDANISVRPAGQTALGTKTELKNMNSFKNVRAAVEYEAGRQMQVVRSGGRIVQETRLWDAERGTSHSMRSKEEAHDYRYFPEPDLPVMVITEDLLEAVRAGLPELPQARRRRLQADYGLSPYDAGVLASDRALADYFEAAAQDRSQAKSVSNWVTVELLAKLNAAGKNITHSPVSPSGLARLVDMIAKGKISGKMGKQVFTEMFATGGDPDRIVSGQGWAQISDAGQLTLLIDQVLAAHPGPVQEYRQGKSQALGFLVGQVMKASQGQANPQLANRLLRERLGEPGAD